MTRQTARPIDHTSLNPSYQTMAGLVGNLNSGLLTLDPPYQRGSVWTEDQRVALIQSLLRGLPAGVVILADRGNSSWAKANPGRDPYQTGEHIWACVDGKQRLTTLLMWSQGELAVPASWIRPELVAVTEDTDDGRYIRHTGLNAAGKRFMDRYCSLLVAETKDCATEAEEAAFYLLVNGGGTPQTDNDMANAAQVAAG